jgi:hypothetical protein
MDEDNADLHRIETTPGLALAAYASLGAGAIHSAAIGVHSEHPAAVLAFVAVAAFQLGWGVWALRGAARPIAVIGVAGNVACVGGWILAKTAGISFVSGLEHVEKVQFADALAATLATISVLACLYAVVLPAPGPRRRPANRAFSAAPALLVAALTVPAMAAAGRHVHSTGSAGSAASTVTTTSTHDHGAVDGGSSPANPVAAGETAANIHTHVATLPDPSTTTSGASSGGQDGTAATAGSPGLSQRSSTANEHPPDATLASSSNWPRPWDPSKPIDLTGVGGVTPDQVQRATTLVSNTLVDLPKYADTQAAIADGYASIGDAGTGTEHFIKPSLIEDHDMLDPNAPESLVYDVKGDQRVLAGAMYIASTRPVGDPSLTDFAGPLIQWHIHDNLCFGINASGKPGIVGITDASGNCARGVRAGGGNPMVHVWIVPRECGVFSALEGIGAGSAAVPDAQRVDKCAHQH